VIRTAAWTMALVGLGLSAMGCGGSKRTLVPVTGTVMYNNAAVEGATVTFSSAGITAFDTTDAEGKFSLRTRAGDGAEPGKYTVTVTKVTQAPPVAAVGADPSPGTASVPDPEGNRADALTSAAGQEVEVLLPAIYASMIQTPLRDYEVKAEGTNDFLLELSDDAAPAAELPAGHAPATTGT